MYIFVTNLIMYFICVHFLSCYFFVKLAYSEEGGGGNGWLGFLLNYIREV